jgi:hypothetical protein
MCVRLFARGLMTRAPRVGLPLRCEPSAYMKYCGFHFRVYVGSCMCHVGCWG